MSVLYLALIVPLLMTYIFYLYKKHEFTWWEFFIPIFTVLIAIVVSKSVIEHTTVTFKEYWGSTVVGVFEEEPYNYWKTETCSRQVACGTDSDGNTEYCTEYYDCSHQVDVSPSWWVVTDIGETLGVSENIYEVLKKQFNTGVKIHDTRRNYSANSRASGSKGTKFEGTRVGQHSNINKVLWLGDDNTRKAYTSIRSYENRIKASDLTLFNISVVDKKTADSLNLFEYPIKYGGFEYPTILGVDVDNDVHEKFRRLNGKFGTSNQLRLWILIFEDKPLSTAVYQENYWVKGNKNELVICIGKNGDEIQWTHVFSWAHSIDLNIEIRDRVNNLFTYVDSVDSFNLPPTLNVLGVDKYINTNRINRIKSPTYPVLNVNTWNELYEYLNDNLHRFNRRSFKEFDYLTVEPSKNAIIVVFVIAFMISIGVNIWVINNDISDTNRKNKHKHHRYRRH